jgi:hypothetical protein
MLRTIERVVPHSIKMADYLDIISNVQYDLSLL